MNTHSRQRHCKHDVTVARGSIERCVTCGAVLTNSENFAETVVKVLQSNTATFKVGDMVEVVGKIDKDWSDYLPVLDRYIGKVGKITFIHDHATSVAFGHAAWNFRPENLRHAKAETVQPTPTEQHRAIAQADDYQGIDGLTDEEIDREVNYQLGFAQRRVEILTGELAAMRLRAERAEHFVRIIAGLRTNNIGIGESEAGQLVRTAQATLQPITTKAGEP